MNDKSLPFVTIGIPTYNRAASYLKNAVQSAVDQTYMNTEIIVSDNCSDDNTEELVKSFNDPRIRYFKQSRNIGMLNNSNFCLEQARGDYFLLLHDDDTIDSDFVDTCMKTVQHDTDVGVILTGSRVIDESGSVVSETPNKAEGLSTSEFMQAWFEYKIALYLCSTLFNTRRLKELGGFRSKTNQYDDAVALFQLAAKYGRKDINQPKSNFRRHSDNSGTVVSSIIDWCADSLYLLDIMCELVPENKDVVREAGMRYFSIQNYIRASRIQSLSKRMQTYMLVYKTFNYSCSPFHYMLAGNFFYENTRRLISCLKRYMKKEVLVGSQD